MRTLLAAMVLATAASAGAQQKSGALEQGAAFFRSAWGRVQKEGPVAAERIVRANEARFRDLRARAVKLTKTAEQFVDMKSLEERKMLLTQLWQLRGSLNLVALLEPTVMQQLTGLDPATVKALLATVTKATASLQSLKRAAP